MDMIFSLLSMDTYSEVVKAVLIVVEGDRSFIVEMDANVTASTGSVYIQYLHGFYLHRPE